MRIQLKWFLSQRVTPLEERDELLGPKTTMLEIKGLIQIEYTYPAKHTLLISHKTLRENHETLESIGIVDQATADLPENVIVVHVLSSAELEGDDDESNPTSATGSTILEYKHDDFIKASKMLGRNVPVDKTRSAAIKADPPRARPSFLDAQPASKVAAAAPSSASTESEVYRIFKNVIYGLRKEAVEKKFALVYPGVESFDFWDVRLSHEGHRTAEGEICLELFYFGDLTEKTDHAKFHSLAVESMAQHGFRVRAVGEIREAGCMYPLIAVPIIISESEAMLLGGAVFERFGQPIDTSAPVRTRATADPAAGGDGAKPECLVM